MGAFFLKFGDLLLFVSSLLILAVSIILTFRTRFVQFRTLPQMFRLLLSLIFRPGADVEGKKTVQAHKALFTAMSTTIGISTIVSPVIAIRLGGPGAVLGFLFGTLFGTAVNFAEVTFALFYRKRLKEGAFAGGPMQYLNDEIGPFVAKWYAFFCFLLLMCWSAAQANQLAEILNSPMLGSWRIPNSISGIALAIGVTIILIGGIKRVANVSGKLVPLMFILYVGSSLWIVLCNVDKLPAICGQIIHSAFVPGTFGKGLLLGGIVGAFRWGLFKGLQSSEAGVGTQTIPHSMAETETPLDQGILSMISTYSAGFICILSSLVTLITQTWMDETLSLGINMVAKSFTTYFSFVGIIVVVLSAFLFAFGTILGNSYNGSQCFSYLTKNRFVNLYYLAVSALIFVGCILDVALVWSLVDFILVPVVVPHILSILYLSYKRGDLLLPQRSPTASIRHLAK